MVLSFTFVELGQHLMSRAAAWQTPVCIRTSIMNKVQGGWANLLRLYLRRQLFGPSGLAGAGLPLELADGTVVPLFAKLHAVLADGDGLRIGFDWRGHSSLKPCLRHFNVFKKELDK